MEVQDDFYFEVAFCTKLLWKLSIIYYGKYICRGMHQFIYA